MAIKPEVLIPSTLVAGGIPVGGYFAYQHVYSDRSLLSRLKSELKESPHKKILSKEDEEWSKWKIVYEKDTKNQISGVEAKDISNWCDSQLKGSDSKNYENVSKWCVINTRSLRQEAEASGRNLISVEGSDSSAWENAWEYYNQNKSGMEIKDSKLSATSSTKQVEGPKLKEWCKGILDKKMYENI
ncbi:hypothetical protein HF1_05980 [Mycoplasma haemofelis str. Langford 1]|uniref:Uncharacterized protein n=2 Tax=Mycoplasma haemofelis TaxID=29501 RepID=F6FI72_MYCHI|nr:hypothetical protein [Mycoplasma haemofelis]AEG72920.1 hypothetical protein MHF_0648 [Mycoplasma haemofelis Ohio2]CBY92606.1 hypothetical protein HF1_05980 [Mycoplasma haemofelis str. Langford 1]